MTIRLTDELFSGIQAVLTSSILYLTPSLTVRVAGHMLDKQMIHLLIANLVLMMLGIVALALVLNFLQ